MKVHLQAGERVYTIGDEMRADFPLRIGHEHAGVPSIAACRHAVLRIKQHDGYVVYDRLLNRIVNGVYFNADDALATAAYYNADPEAPGDMSPGATGLGLLFPERQ